MQSARQSHHMRRYSTLAGGIIKLSRTKPYVVEYESANSHDSLLYRGWARIIAYGSLGIVLMFAYILFQPSHWIVFKQPHSSQRPENWLMLICLGILQIFIIIGTYSATRSTVKAKNPMPVRYFRHRRVAFATTRAPGEPVDMVRRTLEAATRIRHKTLMMDIWLLDETNDDELRAICKELGVHHFSRAGKALWNQVAPKRKRLLGLLLAFRWFGAYAASCPASLIDRSKARPYDPYYAAKTKHGNFNAWRQFIAKNGFEYDILAGVDTDHVPELNYLERTLGYFRDPNVAYVVSPQVYGNYAKGLGKLVVRWAESQASFFQSTVQRAGNATNSSMFVGTNYAIRMKALDQINGFQPCITEDMATGLAIHAARNPETGKRWKSVYTPDVLAVGEGPDFWATYFTQQWRWAAGTFDTWRRQVPSAFLKISPGARLHYFLMLTFYPIAALTWLFGIVSSVTYMLTGATAILAPWNQFVSLYLMSIVLQFSLYFWNRRINVSPFDKEGTYGVPGMALTSLTAPIYLSALFGIVRGKKASFVVTKKGSHPTAERLSTFSVHLLWALLLLCATVVAFLNGHTHPAMMIWVALQFLVCLLPAAIAFANAWTQGAFKLLPAKDFVNKRRISHV
jgi:cellulose synthase/poly-beta-1,6-N-acetylglucosamine synthase-like glycosyltransferase